MFLIAAVVATHNRPVLLANRALESISRQSRLPDYLVVVDDSDSKARSINQKIVSQFRIEETKTVYLENSRSPGAAGAWNTALSWLQGIEPSSFVAILDDDDAWSTTYLERCEKKALEGRLDMVAAGIIRHTSSNDPGKPLTIPEQLDVKELLVRNPHVQGSNLFVRLRKLLEAGGFDESLASTTDRDICIRLADLNSVRYGSLRKHLVHHYAERERERLSTRGGKAKRAGLTEFYRKYSGRMSLDQRTAFISRSRKLFDCDPTEALKAVPPTFTDPISRQPVSGRLDLIVGIITSPEVEYVSRLLDDLITRLSNRSDVALEVLLLENGSHALESRSQLGSVVDRASRRGLDIELKTLEEQYSDMENGIFATTSGRMSRRKSIAEARTMLQRYLYLKAKPRRGSVVWVLDDDIRLTGLDYGSSGSIEVIDIDYVAAIKRLRQTGACAVLGEVVGDPPLPFLSCIRTQLVDLYYNLWQLSTLNPESQYPDRTDENRSLRISHHDYYYDLSRTETDRLEAPFWYEAYEDDLQVGQAFVEMVSRLPEILDGRQIFRPLVQTIRDNHESDLVTSVQRGPSTLVFDIETLREFPNSVPTIGGCETRRSDMIWCLLNRFARGCTIVKGPLPVRQVRRSISGSEPGYRTLAHDIRGHALYSSLYDVLQEKAEKHQGLKKLPFGREFLSLDLHEIKGALELYRNYLHERLRGFELSFIRVIGIISALRRFCDRSSSVGTAPWWLESPLYEATVNDLRQFIDTISSIYTEEELYRLKKELTEIDISPVELYLRTLPETVARHRSITPLPKKGLRATSEQYVKKQFDTGPLRCLGIGEEGVSLTDGKMVFKYFHHWKCRNKERQIRFLLSIAGKLAGYTALPDIRQVHRDGDNVVVVYPYEEGTRYEGGHLDQILTLLRESREAGLVCRNIHPDNLLVTSSGIRMIDIGSDVVADKGDDFEQMCRRAYLTYRFHYRTDLKHLMTRALNDPFLPEFSGFDEFMNALDPRGLDELLFEPIANLIVEQRPRTVLDYGTGNGRLAESLAQRGISVTAYDPDTSKIERCKEHGNLVTYGDKRLLSSLLEDSARFDSAVCSRVLCTMSDTNELDNILKDLRQLVADSGTVVVAVCNPFHVSTVSTELAVKEIPADFLYEDTFSYLKTVASNGKKRTEVHRSLSEYRRAFNRAGFVINGIVELEGSDTTTLRPASDHLLFSLIPLPAPTPRISLLIKTCLMEWKYIERMVRHQIDQLEKPVGFVEKIVVVDPSEGPFVRQYEQPNAELHSAAMNRLVEDGIVDRVVYAPDDPETIRNTFLKWFGAESNETHSTNGQQLFATLYGFESCIGDYVLQLDSDLLITRSDKDHNYLAEMTAVLRRDPAALFVPLSICRGGKLPYTPQGPNGDWRVEVRGCMFDRRRLNSVRPVRNALESGRFSMTWHRSFDRLIAEGDYRSYRGGDPRTAFIHVPNDRKTDVTGLFEVVNAIERGFVPSCQSGSADLVGSPADWAGPKRGEPFVFVICGRNVDPSRFRRCLQSLVLQDADDWGAVIVDDASTNGFGDYAKVITANYADRFTIVRNNSRRGSLYNLWNAVTRYCTNPETVILTLDADDALTGTHVLKRVRAEYDDGADLTVGSMLRLDKEIDYTVDFESPRSWSSNVWIHLRTFRKYLFDAINVNDLQLDGQWIDLASDWAYMVPLVELASDPRFIRELLYIYEPGRAKTQAYRRKRDAVIARILDNPGYGKLI